MHANPANTFSNTTPPGQFESRDLNLNRRDMQASQGYIGVSEKIKEKRKKRLKSLGVGREERGKNFETTWQKDGDA